MKKITLSENEWTHLKNVVQKATKQLEASKTSQPLAKELKELINQLDNKNVSVVTTATSANELPIEDIDDIMNEIENESKKDETAVKELPSKVAEFIAKPV